MEKIFAFHGLKLFDVEELATHGGSLRIYACHNDDETKAAGGRVVELRQRELAGGVSDLGSYSSFTEKVKKTKRLLLDFLIQAKDQGRSIAGYGAPGKGNTLLNYCGVRTDFIDYRLTAIPINRGNICPGPASRSFIRTRSKRRAPASFSFCHGISKMKSWSRCRSYEIGAESLSCLSPRPRSSDDFHANKT